MKQLLLQQFKAVFNDTGWHVTLSTAISELTEVEANWKSDGIDNSIFQLVNHLIFWNDRYLRKFKGLELGGKLDSNEETFENTGNHTWPEAVAKLHTIMKEWEQLIADASFEELSGRVSRTNTDNWYNLLAHINTHNVYHVGQIIVIRKLQGAWDKTKGVG